MINACLDFRVVKTNVKIYPKIFQKFIFKLRDAFFLFFVLFSIQYSKAMVRRPSVVRCPFSTLSSLNISLASWPILIKIYIKHHWLEVEGGGVGLHKGLRQIGSKLWFPRQPKSPIDI